MLSLTLTHRNRNFLFFNFDFQKYPALTLEVAGDLRRAPVTFENTEKGIININYFFILLVKIFFELVKMTFGLVDVGYSLPKGQAVKLIFFAPC